MSTVVFRRTIVQIARVDTLGVDNYAMVNENIVTYNQTNNRDQRMFTTAI